MVEDNSFIDGGGVFVGKQVTDSQPYLPSALVSCRLLASTRARRRVKMKVSSLFSTDKYSFLLCSNQMTTGPPSGHAGDTASFPPHHNSSKTVKLEKCAAQFCSSVEDFEIIVCLRTAVRNQVPSRGRAHFGLCSPIK